MKLWGKGTLWERLGHGTLQGSLRQGYCDGDSDRDIKSKAKIGKTGSEVVTRNIERELGIGEEAKVGEIGSEVVAGSIEREIEARGTMIETVVGNIERGMNVIDIDVGTNEMIEMYAKVFLQKEKFR